jgi:ACS family hexuronate transporter-like MFS transporter
MPFSSAEIPALSRSRAWGLVFVATFTMAVSYFDRQTMAALAPTLTRELGISEQEYGWVVSAFSFAYLIGAPLAGAVVDSVGARRTLFVGVLTWSFIAALQGAATGFLSLCALRAALGFAEAPSFSGAAQVVQRTLAPTEQPRGFGVLFVGTSAGAMLAPIMSNSLATRFGWRIAIAGTAGLGLLWVPLWLFSAFREPWRGVLDSRATLRRAKPFRFAECAREVRDVALQRAVARAVVVVLATSPVVAFILNWQAKFLSHEYGLKQAQLASYLWIAPVGFDLGSLVFGHLGAVRAKRAFPRSTPPRALFVCAFLCLVFVAALARSGGATNAAIIGGIAMIGAGGILALITAELFRQVPPDRVSTACGITTAAQSLAYIAAAPLMGSSVQRNGSYQTLVWQLAVWSIPGCVIWLTWQPPAVPVSSIAAMKSKSR